MFSSEEKIYSPESRTPRNAKETVPKKFKYDKPGSKYLHQKIKNNKFARAIIVTMVVAGGIVFIVNENNNKSKYHREENS